MKKNNTTELVFILDESGSMAGLVSDTIGGFNALIEKQKQLEGKVYVSTVMFSNQSRVVHDRVDISEIRPLTDRDYTPGGCTALMDAIGGAIRHIGMIHRYARPEDVPEHTIFVITTDGMENASHRYSAEEVRQMIKKEETSGWEFLFLAANIDAVETGALFGIREDRAVNYQPTCAGTKKMYACASRAVEGLRRRENLDADWGAELNK